MNISIYSVFVPLLTGFILYGKIDINSRLLVVLLIFASIPHLAVLLRPPGEKWIYYNLYAIVDSFFWAFLYYWNSKNKFIRRAIILIVSVQVALYLLLCNSVGISQNFFTGYVCLNSLIQLLLILSFFYERYMQDEVLALEKEPIFWFCLGLLLYAPTTYFYFAYYDAIKTFTNREKAGIMNIHHIMNIAMYLIFTIGFITNLKRSVITNVYRRN